MKNEKNYMGFLIPTYCIKYSKFWSVSLEHFIERKPFIYEEWCLSGGKNLPPDFVFKIVKKSDFFFIYYSGKFVLEFPVSLTRKNSKTFPFFPDNLPLVWLVFLSIFVWPKLEYVKRLAFLCAFFQFSIWCTVRWAHSVLEYKSFEKFV